MERNTTPQNRTPEMLDMYAGKDINEKGDIWVCNGQSPSLPCLTSCPGDWLHLALPGSPSASI